MDITPKLQKKTSLSLSARLSKKRHSASPQNRLKHLTLNGVTNSRELNTNCDTPQHSPSAISVSSDGGIECTPPHKKMAINLDESAEFSPRTFDSSFSPTCLLSQTLAIDSPEVGWKWNRRSSNGDDNPISGIENSTVPTPDSAYVAGNSFSSVTSDITEFGNGRTRGYCYKQRMAIDARKKDQRKILEQKIRRVEKTRADEKLQERCAKLQETLKSAGTQNREHDKKSEIVPISSASNEIDMKSQSVTSTSINSSVTNGPAEKQKNSDIFNDFFNDSDLDAILLEATQEVESKIEYNNQAAFTNISHITQKPSISSECTSTPAVPSTPSNNKTVVARTENKTSFNRENKEKRPSFYMQFLEDDCSDDWFISVDEAILQATHNKKSHSSLQRYKSMPAETATNSNVPLNRNDKNDEAAVSSSALSKLKRHSSTHTLSPTSTICRRRRKL